MLYKESRNGQSATVTGFQDNQVAWFLDELYSPNQHNQAFIFNADSIRFQTNMATRERHSQIQSI